MDDLIKQTQRFASAMSDYGSFRTGGNLGAIMQGQLQKEGLETLAKSIDNLSSIIASLTEDKSI